MSIVSGCLEILGVFLLAVEAIKLHNLKWIRENVVSPLALRVNPIIHFVTPKTDEEKAETRAGEIWLYIIIGFLSVFGLLVILGSIYVSGYDLIKAWDTFSKFIPGPIWLGILIALPVGLVTVIIGGIVGSMAYTGVVLFLDALILGLQFIERNTATGIIGILGFLLYLASFVLRNFIK